MAQTKQEHADFTELTHAANIIQNCYRKRQAYKHMKSMMKLTEKAEHSSFIQGYEY